MLELLPAASVDEGFEIIAIDGKLGAIDMQYVELSTGRQAAEGGVKFDKVGRRGRQSHMTELIVSFPIDLCAPLDTRYEVGTQNAVLVGSACEKDSRKLRSFNASQP